MPLHPLAVHLPVVIIPLTALGLLAWVLVPSLGAKVRSWLVGGGVLGVIGTAWSNTTGAELLKDIGRSPQSPGDVAPHMMWGNALVVASVFLAAAAIALWYKETVVTQIAAVIMAVVALIITFGAGHSGAQLVWH